MGRNKGLYRHILRYIKSPYKSLFLITTYYSFLKYWCIKWCINLKYIDIGTVMLYTSIMKERFITMEEKKEFNQFEYINKYKREHYKSFRADLKKEEMEDLDLILKKLKINKAEFLREAIQKAKEELMIN